MEKSEILYSRKDWDKERPEEKVDGFDIKVYNKFIDVFNETVTHHSETTFHPEAFGFDESQFGVKINDSTFEELVKKFMEMGWSLQKDVSDGEPYYHIS